MLFYGLEGVGKGWLARHLAAALLCGQPTQSGRACGACQSCRWLAADSHPDMRVLRPAADEPDTPDVEAKAPRATTKPSKDIRIEQIRGLAGFAATASHQGGRKVVLLTPADAMNSAAANALLKMLEEPNPGTFFLLVTSRPERLAATVRSRCRKVVVTAPDPETARDWVMKATGADPTRVKGWLAFASGAPLRAVDLARGEAGQALDTLVPLISSLPGDVLSSAEVLASHETRAWVGALHAWCIDLARCAVGAPPAKFPSDAKRLNELAAQLDQRALFRFEAWLNGLERLVGHPLNPRMLAEDALLRYQAVFKRTSTG